LSDNQKMKAAILLLLLLAAAGATAQEEEEGTVVVLHDVAQKHLRPGSSSSAPEQPISQQAITAAVASACSLTPPYQLGAEEAKQVGER
jgi:hypothetical protein